MICISEVTRIPKDILIGTTLKSAIKILLEPLNLIFAILEKRKLCTIKVWNLTFFKLNLKIARKVSHSSKNGRNKKHSTFVWSKDIADMGSKRKLSSFSSNITLKNRIQKSTWLMEFLTLILNCNNLSKK